MICFGTIGYFSDAPGSQSYPIPGMYELFPSEGNFIGVVGIDSYSDFAQAVYRHMAASELISVFPFCLSRCQLSGPFIRSEELLAVWLQCPDDQRHFISAQPHYHQKSDTIDNLYFARMTAVVNSVFDVVVRL